MATRSEMSTGTTIMAFLIGSAAGLAAGMLFAPKSGRETREQIASKAKESASKAQDMVEHGRDAAKSKFDHAIDTAKTVATESKAAARDAKRRIGTHTA